MTSFKEAVDVATENAKSLIANTKNIVLESVMLSDDDALYEVSLSYDVKGESPLDITATEAKNGIARLAEVMAYRRHQKTFYVDKNNGEFKGFRDQQDG